MKGVRPIPGYERYGATRCGKIYTLQYGRYKGKAREMKTVTNEYGYSKLTFTVAPNRKKTLLVHRLVAMTYISNPLNLPQINHRDGIKSNNDVRNLEWVSAKQNTQHALNNGLSVVQGSNSGMSKLSDAQVRQIKKELKQPYLKQTTDLAKIYGVSRCAINDIKFGRTWRHI